MPKFHGQKDLMTIFFLLDLVDSYSAREHFVLIGDSKELLIMASSIFPDCSPSLPENLIDSYKQDKSDTDCFAKWLANIGEKCGYRLSINRQTTAQSADSPFQKQTPRLKGKARKLARNVD
jgi:hypothetical protein